MGLSYKAVSQLLSKTVFIVIPMYNDYASVYSLHTIIIKKTQTNAETNKNETKMKHFPKIKTKLK